MDRFQVTSRQQAFSARATWRVYICLLTVLFAISTQITATTLTVNFEKPQTTANFPAQFYDSKGKGTTINQGTGGVTVNFSGGELLTGAKAIFPPDNTTLYASTFPPAVSTGSTISWTYSVPMDNLSILLMNSVGSTRDFTFSANGQALPNAIALGSGKSTTVNFRVNGNWLTNVTSVGVTSAVGDAIIPSWTFAVDDINSTLAPEPGSLLLAGAGLIAFGALRRKNVNRHPSFGVEKRDEPANASAQS